MRTDCTDKPEGFSFVEMRCKELLDSIKTCLFLPVAEENKDDVGCKFYLYYEISDWAENLDSIHLSLLSNQDAWGPDTAIACIKEEYDIIMAGVNSIKLEEERRLLHKIDRANRSLFWFGESFQAIDNNPFEIISILYDAFVKGVQWVSLEDIRRRCQGNHTIKDTETSKAGIADVFTVRRIDPLTRERSRKKIDVWKIIETKGRKSPSYRLIDPREKNPE